MNESSLYRDPDGNPVDQLENGAGRTRPLR